MLENLLLGFQTVLSVKPILYILAGLIIGIVVGSIPGLTGSMAIALIVPLTFEMDAVNAIILLLALYCSGVYGGSISAILVRAPGTPANAATIFDGYEMAKQGKAMKALNMAVYASIIGNLWSVLLLLFLSPIVAYIAIKLGPAEIASLIIFSLTIIAYVSGKSIVKGLITAGIGFFACLIGLDPITSMPRLTFGITELERGIGLIPQSIGLFAVSEVFMQAGTAAKDRLTSQKLVTVIPKSDNPEDNRVSLKEMMGTSRTIAQSAVIGSILGAIPGVGTPIASFMGYGLGKRFSRHPEKYGTGFLEGVAASEAANNGVVGASMIPLLTLGIPGDLPTAILLGAFLLHGLIPGPMLFVEHPLEVYSLFAAFLLAVILLFFVAKQFIKVGHLLTRVPKATLFPVVLVFCFIGCYSVNTSMLDIWVMFVFGLIGCFLESNRFPLAPLLIAFLLGPILENALRQALLLGAGTLKLFLYSPVSLVLLAITVFVIIQVITQTIKKMHS